MTDMRYEAETGTWVPDTATVYLRADSRARVIATVEGFMIQRRRRTDERWQSVLRPTFTATDAARCAADGLTIGADGAGRVGNR